MRLGIDDETVENPTAGDIERRIPDRSPHEAWSAFLERDDETWIEADAVENGRYRVSHVEGTKIFEGGREVDGQELRKLFALYLKGDDRFRQNMTWEAWDAKPVPQGTSSRKQGYWPVVVMPVAAILLFVVLELLSNWIGQIPWDRLPLPEWMKTTPALLVIGFFFACVLLVLVALIVKSFEVRRMARWPKTMGRIVRSQSGLALTRTDSKDIPRNERVADIVYEFEVNGRKYRGKRFTLAEKVSEEEVPGILAQHPVGKIVPVYYDPSNPEDCTLERELPKGLLLGCLPMLGFGLAGVIGTIFAVTTGLSFMEAKLPNAIAPLVLLLGGGALIVLIVGIGILRGTFEARRWPKTTGTVTSSGVHDFELARNRSRSSVRSSSGTTTSYMPVVEYTYKVAGKSYTSRSVRLDTEVAGSRSYAEKLAARYPAGAVVRVYYDPKDPMRSALEIRSGLAWGMLALAAALLAGAILATGIFTPGGR
jgi:hypothetical protein